MALYRWFALRRRQIGTLTVGYTANWLSIFLFDWVLYPIVIGTCGVLWGGILMTALTFVVCYYLIRFYDWSKTDWLAIELVKEKIITKIKDYRGESRFGRLGSFLLNQTDSIAVLVLSLKFDAAVVTILMREGKYNGLGKRDWRIFISSLLFGSLYWIILIKTGMTAVEFLWRQF